MRQINQLVFLKKVKALANSNIRINKNTPSPPHNQEEQNKDLFSKTYLSHLGKMKENRGKYELKSKLNCFISGMVWFKENL